MIVEDHPSIRKELQDTLIMDARFQLDAACSDLPEAEKLIENMCPDLLLVDLGLPSGSGLKLIQQARNKWGSQCVAAVLIVLENEKNLIASIASGAKGFVYKHNFASSLEDLIKLTQGESYVNALVAELLSLKLSAVMGDVTLNNDKQLQICLNILDLYRAGYLIHETSNKLNLSEVQIGLHLRWIYDQLTQSQPKLSQRELELLILLEQGLSNKECSRIMDISETTTSTYVKRICQKLNVNSIRTAIYEARRAHLLH